MNLWRTVSGLGIGQIIAWGSLYYSIAVLAAPIRAELGLSDLVIFGAFTLSQLISGFAAPFVGRQLDQRGGRVVLVVASLLGAVAFLLLAAATGPVSYTLAWLVAGLAISCGLYDTAMGALSQVAGASYRRAVTGLTLWGGFASTVFWPLGGWLIPLLGWRNTCLVYAGLHLLVNAPLYAWSLPRIQGRRSPPAPAGSAPGATPAFDHRAFAWLGMAFGLASFTVGALSVHIIDTLKAYNFSAGEAIFVAALIGPMQVAGRIAEFLFAGRVRPLTVGTLSLGMLAVSIVLLWRMDAVLVLAVVFVTLYGWSNGTFTIVRGTVPPALFGSDRVGELLGRLSRPAFLARALAPGIFSAVVTAGIPHRTAVLGLALLSVATVGCYLMAIRKRPD
jgi:MFS family permease